MEYHKCMELEAYEMFWALMGWTPEWVGSAVIEAGGFVYTYYMGTVCLV